MRAISIAVNQIPTHSSETFLTAYQLQH